MINNSAAD